MNWTEEMIRAENDYRRQRLHRLASHSHRTAERRHTWWSWLHRRLRR